MLSKSPQPELHLILMAGSDAVLTKNLLGKAQGITPSEFRVISSMHP